MHKKYTVILINEKWSNYSNVFKRKMYSVFKKEKEELATFLGELLAKDKFLENKLFYTYIHYPLNNRILMNNKESELDKLLQEKDIFLSWAKKNNVSKKIIDKIIKRNCFGLRTANSYHYSYYYENIDILIFDERGNNVNLGYLIGDIRKKYDIIVDKDNEKRKAITEKEKNYRERLNQYIYRHDPVPHKGGYHKGHYSSKKGKGFCKRVRENSIPEYEEFSNVKYKMSNRCWGSRENDKSWKSSCKVKKQYMKHGCKEKRIRNTYQCKENSIKEMFFENMIEED